MTIRFLLDLHPIGHLIVVLDLIQAACRIFNLMALKFVAGVAIIDTILVKERHAGFRKFTARPTIWTTGRDTCVGIAPRGQAGNEFFQPFLFLLN